MPKKIILLIILFLASLFTLAPPILATHEVTGCDYKRSSGTNGPPFCSNASSSEDCLGSGPFTGTECCQLSGYATCNDQRIEPNFPNPGPFWYELYCCNTPYSQASYYSESSYCSGDIYGYVFVDTDEDGEPDAGELGYTGGAGVNASGVGSTTTDGGGNYSFIGLSCTSYTVTLTVPPSYHGTSTNPISVSISPDSTNNFFGIAPISTPTPTGVPPTPAPNF